MKKIAVVLAGCGHKDGAEITEAVSLIVELSRQGFALSFFAPDKDFVVRNPITNEPTSEKRNMLTESARITRGHIAPLATLKSQDFVALAFPGGTGVALNLCDWATKGASGSLLPEVQHAIQDFYNAKKPIAAVCIAPVLLAKALGKDGVTLTIGNDSETAQEIQKTGAHHKSCPVTEAVVDTKHRLVTTPAYMYGSAKPHEVAQGIARLAAELKTLLSEVN